MKTLLIFALLSASVTALGQEQVKVTKVTFYGTKEPFIYGLGEGVLYKGGNGTPMWIYSFDFRVSGCHTFTPNSGNSTYVAKWERAPHLRILIPTEGGVIDHCILTVHNLRDLPIGMGQAITGGTEQ